MHLAAYNRYLWCILNFSRQNFLKYYFIFQGSEPSSFQLISSVFENFHVSNFSCFFYFQPIFGILP